MAKNCERTFPEESEKERDREQVDWEKLSRVSGKFGCFGMDKEG